MASTLTTRPAMRRAGPRMHSRATRFRSAAGTLRCKSTPTTCRASGSTSRTCRWSNSRHLVSPMCARTTHPRAGRSRLEFRSRISPTSTTARWASTTPRSTAWRRFTPACRAGSRRTSTTASECNANMKKSGASQGQSASELISKRIAELGDWRGETLSRMRKLIKAADPDVVEEWKWMGTPIWSHDGIICTGESYKNVVKLTFLKGASLKDPARLFNSSLDGNARRAIDIHEGEEVDESAFKALVRQAVALNSSGKSKPSKKAKS